GTRETRQRASWGVLGVTPNVTPTNFCHLRPGNAVEIFMARVPLIQEQEHPEFAGLIEKFRAGRRGKLIHIYRMLLNAPPLAESWFNHSNTVRWQTTLPGRLREIVIIRMGHLASQYVLRQHVPSLALADGLARGMRCARGLACLEILQRERASRARLCRYHDPRHRGARRGLRRG